jgi:hypothetical protein
MLDCARFRRRVLENSLIAFWVGTCQLGPHEGWTEERVKRIGEVPPYVVIAKLIFGQMDGAERATADLIVYGVLIDPVVRPAVVVVAGELDSSVESFLDFAVSAWCALVLSGGAHEAGSATVVRTERCYTAGWRAVVVLDGDLGRGERM